MPTLLEAIEHYHDAGEKVRDVLRGVRPPLAVPDAMLLCWLDTVDNEPKRISSVVYRFGPRVNYALRKLEERGLIAVKVDVYDKRQRKIVTTKKAEVILKILRSLE